MTDRDDIVDPTTLTSVRRVTVVRSDHGRRVVTEDATAAEEPLDVRLHGQSFAIIMRTPGEDQALAAGFLYAERVIRSADDIGALEHCRHPDRTEAHHVVNVFLRGRGRQKYSGSPGRAAPGAGEQLVRRLRSRVDRGVARRTCRR